jgi:chaperonin GroEL
MPKPEVVFAPKSSRDIARGIDILADLLAVTLGPTAGYVLNERAERRGPEFLDDSGVVVRRIISLYHKSDNIGAMLIRQLVWAVVEAVGDGGATAGVLARAIYKDALRLVTAGANPLSLAKGVTEAVKVVVSALRAQACPVTTEDQLAYLARLITRDDDLAAVLGEMSYLLGPNGHVVIENYEAPFLQRRYVAGTHYTAQISSPYFYTDSAAKSATLTDVAMALTDHAIDDVEQAVSLIQAALESGHESLLIIAPQISDKALGVLVTNHRAQKINLKIAVAMLRDSGDARLSAYDDLGLLTGARLLGNAHERTSSAVQAPDLGFARRIDVDQHALVVVAESYRNPAVRAEATRLRQRLDDLPLSAAERPLLVQRLAALTGGIGELKIGAFGKPERDLRRQQAERAIKALALAQRGGVVAGAGAALAHCAPALATLQLQGDAAMGVQVMARALTVPMQQIMENAGIVSPAILIEDVRAAGAPVTYDALQLCIVDGQRCGLIDPVDVIITAVTKAASMAMMALSTETIVYHRNPQMDGNTP